MYIVSFDGRIHFNRTTLSSEANRKSQNLHPFISVADKRKGVPIFFNTIIVYAHDIMLQLIRRDFIMRPDFIDRFTDKAAACILVVKPVRKDIMKGHMKYRSVAYGITRNTM